MVVKSYGMDININFVHRANEIDLIEESISGPQYLGTLFLEIDNNGIGLLNAFDSLSQKVAKTLIEEGLIKKAEKQNPYAVYPSYIIKL